ncbi:Phosphoserine phosphatase, chloroplastic [Vitis vinifera]|uniref:Phosphoserine phosphatase, chloroplastic n=1 Tax=Vitis vinifera TaxID=29760 RepID=A0A438DBM4_VITVI|nr:Phosphoserine phosphatase, chloroplastic [Vitis vinifera]
MEGLMRVRTNPIHLHCGRHHSPSLPAFPTLQLHKKFYRNSFGMMKHPKSFNSVVASVQPLEASTRFDNTLPSKDHSAAVDDCSFQFLEILELWQDADAVCFDVDSTVCVDEGIDELAEFCGAGKAVAEWTARAMGGSVPFEEALAARLSLFKPSLSQVQDFLEKRPPR